jgi:hypothetical protein
MIIKANYPAEAPQIGKLIEVHRSRRRWKRRGKGAGSGMSSEYKAVYDEMAVKPSPADAVIQATWLDAMVAAGYYAKAELLDMFSCDTQANSLFNWKDPTGAHNPTLVNAPTFTAYSGFKGIVAGNRYGRLHFIPSTDATVIGQDNICMMVGVGDDVTEDSYDVGVTDLASNNLFIISKWGGTTAYYCANNSGLQGIANANSKKHYAISRTAGAGYDSYIQAAKSAIVRASTGLPDKELFFCCFNNGVGAPTSISTRGIRYVFLFSYLTEAEIAGVRTLTEAYLDNYGTGLI